MTTWDRAADQRLRRALANAEVRLATRGLPCFPCCDRGKEPLTKHGCKDATTDVGQLRMWRERWPRANIAIATGGAMRLLVVDIDGDGGEGTIRAIEAAHGPLPETVEVITGGGGRHVYLRAPEDAPIGNTVAHLGDGVDTRGDGGYVIAPPSIHPSGRRYAWSVDCANTIAAAPPWLVASLNQGHNGANGKCRPAEEWLDVVTAGIEEGRRNTEMARLAGLLFRRVAPQVAVELAACFNQTRCRPPLSAIELKRILDSVATREMKRRGLVDGSG